MKNFNLSLIALICGSFLFVHNSCHANTITMPVVKYSSDLTTIVSEDGIDPDWTKLIGYLCGNTVSIDQKI